MTRLFNVIQCHSTDLHSHLSRVQYRRVRSSENRLLLSQHVPVEIEPIVMQPFVGSEQFFVSFPEAFRLLLPMVPTTGRQVSTSVFYPRIGFEPVTILLSSVLWINQLSPISWKPLPFERTLLKYKNFFLYQNRSCLYVNLDCLSSLF